MLNLLPRTRFHLRRRSGSRVRCRQTSQGLQQQLGWRQLFPGPLRRHSGLPVGRSSLRRRLRQPGRRRRLLSPLSRLLPARQRSGRGSRRGERPYNGAGASGYSDPASATTLEGALILSATGYKVKGVQTADLQWTGATTVVILRDGFFLRTVTGSAYTDSTGNKGGGSYTYQVCASDGGGNCSDPVTVTF